MSCYNPIPFADFGTKVNKNGKTVRNIRMINTHGRFYEYGLDDIKQFYGDRLMLVPCGKCYGCCSDYARMWASRICLEAKFHLSNCFITLTYSDINVPNKLTKRPFQLFMKRLRKEVGSVRFFACGEVGEGKGSRGYNPHYHAVIFGYDFPDKEFLKRSSSGMIIYRSALLERLWPYGMSSIGSVTPESAQYVAKYSMKRKTTSVDLGEFVLMSRRPGIGFAAFDESDYVTDRIYLYGKKYKMPRYFDKIAESLDSFDYLVAKDNRVALAKNFKSKKFLFNVHREEQSLDIMKENDIRSDILKVRLL